MKKLLVLITAIFSLSSAAHAKTEGSSVGVTILRAHSVQKSSTNTGSVFRDESKHGIGVNYKYAFALPHDFYIAPGLSAEHLGTHGTNGVTSTAVDKVDIGNRYMARADLGYDINDHLAAYLIAGYAATSYKTYNFTSGASEKRSSHNWSPVFGIGAKTSLCPRLDLVFEYTNQHLNLRSTAAGDKAKTSLSTYAVGLSYNF